MKYSRLTTQHGFTLIMSMVFLLILTVLGLSATQGTRLEVAMAGNLRNSDMSFQSAEVGLQSGEEFIDGSVSKSDYLNQNASGLYSIYSDDPEDPDYFDHASWDNATASKAQLGGVSAQPLFIIKYLGDRSQNEVAAVNIGGYGSQQPGFTVSNFRVTSKGFGQTATASRLLQSYYGRSF